MNSIQLLVYKAEEGLLVQELGCMLAAHKAYVMHLCVHVHIGACSGH